MSKIIGWLTSLFNLSKPVYIVILLFVALIIVALAVKSHAADAPYVQVSGGSTIVRGSAPVLDLGITAPSSIGQGDFWKGDLTIIGSSTWYGDHAPNNFALRGMYVTGFGHFDLGLGLSWMQNPLPYNGGNINFSLEAAYRFERWPITVTYAHMSDAGTKLPNYGRDLLMAGWRFGR